MFNHAPIIDGRWRQRDCNEKFNVKISKALNLALRCGNILGTRDVHRNLRYVKCAMKGNYQG